MPGPFEFKLSRYFNTGKISVGTESKTAFMKLKSLKMAVKIYACKPEGTFIAAFSMVNFLIM